jgi:hypothetical protein
MGVCASSQSSVAKKHNTNINKSKPINNKSCSKSASKSSANQAGSKLNSLNVAELAIKSQSKDFSLENKPGEVISASLKANHSKGNFKRSNSADKEKLSFADEASMSNPTPVLPAKRIIAHGSAKNTKTLGQLRPRTELKSHNPPTSTNSNQPSESLQTNTEIMSPLTPSVANNNDKSIRASIKPSPSTRMRSINSYPSLNQFVPNNDCTVIIATKSRKGAQSPNSLSVATENSPHIIRTSDRLSRTAHTIIQFDPAEASWHWSTQHKRAGAAAATAEVLKKLKSRTSNFSPSNSWHAPIRSPISTANQFNSCNNGNFTFNRSAHKENSVVNNNSCKGYGYASSPSNSYHVQPVNNAMSKLNQLDQQQNFSNTARQLLNGSFSAPDLTHSSMRKPSKPSSRAYVASYQEQQKPAIDKKRVESKSSTFLKPSACKTDFVPHQSTNNLSPQSGSTDDETNISVYSEAFAADVEDNAHGHNTCAQGANSQLQASSCLDTQSSDGSAYGVTVRPDKCDSDDNSAGFSPIDTNETKQERAKQFFTINAESKASDLYNTGSSYCYQLSPSDNNIPNAIVRVHE